MTWDWGAVREVNRIALLRVLATLFAALGLVPGGSITSLPRHLRCYGLRILKSAEAAGRRIVVSASRELVVDLPPARAPAPAKKAAKRGKSARSSGFPLIEPLRRFERQRYARGPGPRMFFFSGFDPVVTAPAVLLPDDPMDASRLCGRLNALQAVLEDVPKYAKRVALWQARSSAKGCVPRRISPLRTGWPPGYRKRQRYSVDAILMECHILDLNTQRVRKPPDTS